MVSCFIRVMMLKIVLVWVLSLVAYQSTLQAQEDSKSLDAEKQLVGRIEQLDPALSELIDVDEKMEILASGHQWTEGPVWDPAANHLLYSDVPQNKIYCWSVKLGNSVFMDPSGSTGTNRVTEPGSNGLALDQEGRLLVCDQGNRRVYRVETDGTKTTLADRYAGQRFNSPNDLVSTAAGEIYFTDPPYGLPDRSQRELDFCGVFRIEMDGSISLVTRELEFPNGVALSPDGKTLYVAQSHVPAPIYQAYSISTDGKIDPAGKRFYDATQLASAGDPGMPDGMAVDVRGNLWATGPGGVLIISPAGKLLGRIMLGKATANCCFGGTAGSTLFITSTDRVGRIETKTKGLSFAKIPGQSVR